MNFARVKLLLISVFLALNLFLAYQWWSLQTVVSVYAEPLSDQLAHAQSMLASHNVGVIANLPTNPPALPRLKVTYDHTALNAYAAFVLGLKVNQISRWQHQNSIVRAPAITFSEAPLGVYHVSYKKPLTVFSDTGKQKISDNWRTWFAKHGYNASNYQYLAQYIVGKSTVVQFAQQLNGYPVFSARLSLHVEKGDLLSYTQQSVVMLSSDTPRPLISAVSALLSLAAYLDKANLSVDNTIVDVRLGYASLISTVGQWVLVPVWRMQSDRGVFLFIDVSGEVGVYSQ